MSHLLKKANGHLLKKANGHLVRAFSLQTSYVLTWSGALTITGIGDTWAAGTYSPKTLTQYGGATDDFRYLLAGATANYLRLYTPSTDVWRVWFHTDGNTLPATYARAIYERSAEDPAGAYTYNSQQSYGMTIQAYPSSVTIATP